MTLKGHNELWHANRLNDKSLGVVDGTIGYGASDFL